MTEDALKATKKCCRELQKVRKDYGAKNFKRKLHKK
jgi:hypothetical protein